MLTVLFACFIFIFLLPWLLQVEILLQVLQEEILLGEREALARVAATEATVAAGGHLCMHIHF